MQERKIEAEEVREALQTCEIIANYEDDYPLPSCLVLGKTKKGRSLHLVVAINEENKLLWIITVYQPNKTGWEKGFKIRRRKK